MNRLRWQRWLLFARRSLGVMLVLATGALAAWLFFLSWHPSTSDYPLQGVDVSDEQGVIDWPVVRADGVDFVYLRATYGATGRDTTFETNWHDVYAAGLRRGAYHRYSLCQLAVDQANNFNTVVPHDGDALPAAVLVDFDADCPARPAREVVVGEIARLMAMIENHTGKPAMLKVSRRFDDWYRLSAAIPRPIWAIANFFPPDYAARPWRMWQANDRRRIDGVDRPVHWNVVAR
jgi:lysozyme